MEAIIVAPKGGHSRSESGSMGLRGMWALIGNSSAMVLLSVVLFISIYQIHLMHREGMAALISLHDQERAANLSVNQQFQKVVQDNTQAIKDLSREIQHIRGVRGLEK